jgi:hypothetical protein
MIHPVFETSHHYKGLQTEYQHDEHETCDDFVPGIRWRARFRDHLNESSSACGLWRIVAAGSRISVSRIELLPASGLN